MWIPLLRNILIRSYCLKNEVRNKENLPKKASEAARMAYNTRHITWEPSALHRTPQGKTGAVRKAHLCLNNQYILMSLTLQ